ncbi:CPBP family intramembrane glutamic endopeptidase [Kribbella sp. NPDC056861]|uniref:CPBP family intramembrane glutamic endopeptidase n=1 Tax=Kribbella sp. NPDC056861 TaxID=3154857 RepID=UPI003442AB56
MTIMHTTTPVRYDRLARIAGRHDWWRPIVGTGLLAVLALAGMVLVYELSSTVGDLLGLPLDKDDWPIFDDVTAAAIDLLAIAIMLPALALTLRLVQKRGWGSITSVTGRLRLAWLGRCLVVAAATTVVTMGGTIGLSYLTDPGATEGPWVGWRTFVIGLPMLICLVPLQAAAEEYVFRGWLLQATGSLFRSPVTVVVPQALLFAAAHGWGTPWGFADLAVFGVLAGWLTIRTGGLEAAIALHVTTNLIAMVLASVFAGGLSSDETAAELPWPIALLDLAMVLVFAALILRLARIRGVTTEAPQYSDGGSRNTPVVNQDHSVVRFSGTRSR